MLDREVSPFSITQMIENEAGWNPVFGLRGEKLLGRQFFKIPYSNRLCRYIPMPAESLDFLDSPQSLLD